MCRAVRSPYAQAYQQLELVNGLRLHKNVGNKVSSPRYEHAPKVVQPLLRQGVVPMDMVTQNTTLK